MVPIQKLRGAFFFSVKLEKTRYFSWGRLPPGQVSLHHHPQHPTPFAATEHFRGQRNSSFGSSHVRLRVASPQGARTWGGTPPESLPHIPCIAANPILFGPLLVEQSHVPFSTRVRTVDLWGRTLKTWASAVLFCNQRPILRCDGAPLGHGVTTRPDERGPVLFGGWGVWVARPPGGGGDRVRLSSLAPG